MGGTQDEKEAASWQTTQKLPLRSSGSGQRWPALASTRTVSMISPPRWRLPSPRYVASTCALSAWLSPLSPLRRAGQNSQRWLERAGLSTCDNLLIIKDIFTYSQIRYHCHFSDE